MNLGKMAPWNWFKKEEKDIYSIPVNHSSIRGHAPYSGRSLEPVYSDTGRILDNILKFLTQPQSFNQDYFINSLTDGLIKPQLNIATNDSEYSISIELPGVDQKDIKLEITDRTLTIRGEKRQEDEEKKQNYYRIERSYGAFQRILELPEDSDKENINASFKKGVLTIKITRKALVGSGMKRININ